MSDAVKTALVLGFLLTVVLGITFGSMNERRYMEKMGCKLTVTVQP